MGRRRHIENQPSSAVTVLGTTTGSTIIAGFANGVVVVQTVLDGTEIARVKLHGPLAAMMEEGGRIHMLSELGQTATIDLSRQHESYCELLRSVWSQVGDLARRCSPRSVCAKPAHVCGRRVSKSASSPIRKVSCRK